MVSHLFPHKMTKSNSSDDQLKVKRVSARLAKKQKIQTLKKDLKSDKVEVKVAVEDEVENSRDNNSSKI